MKKFSCFLAACLLVLWCILVFWPRRSSSFVSQPAARRVAPTPEAATASVSEAPAGASQTGAEAAAVSTPQKVPSSSADTLAAFRQWSQSFAKASVRERAAMTAAAGVEATHP